MPEAGGELRGLPRPAVFDGSCIVFEPRTASGEPEVWEKVGCWRLDWLRKALLTLAAIGLALAFAATWGPPSLGALCSSGSLGRRLPLRSFFLLDASGSVSAKSWLAEKKATEEIINAFQDVYATEPGDVHVGVAQFASDATLEVAMTSDVDSVLAALRGMTQKPGGTVFSAALKLCQRQISGYGAAGNRTFDLCVLITDGMDSESGFSPRSLLPEDTALFGIYVGSDTSAANKLRDMSTCGAADHRPSCHFFASATDFDALQRSAQDVARNVSRGSDAAGGLPREHMPGWAPLLLLAILPCLSWWVYLLLPQRRPEESAPPAPAREIREPLRLRAAGMNEGRRGMAGGQELGPSHR